MTERTLVTGFGPFPGVVENPSCELAEASGRKFQILEVSYEAADQFVWSLDPESFDVWLMLGVASGRKSMNLELFARNVKRGRDATGREEPGEIEAGGPLLVDSTLWTPEVAADLVRRFENVGTSMNAGAYLCNYLSYRAIRHLPSKRVGFLHVTMPDAIALDRQSEVIGKILETVESIK